MDKPRKLVGERIYLGPIDVADAPLYSRWLMDMELAANLNAAAMVFGIEDEEKWIRFAPPASQ